jgi:calcium/calmodulin-dependent protein kinase I
LLTNVASDVWAIGVITFFLLCGYTPFDRDSNLEEMQAILAADYHFDEEYWRGVSQTAQRFIDRCLTIDPKKRMTAHEALSHPWIAPTLEAGGDRAEGADLLPTVRKNFNARRKLHAAIDTVLAINKLREGGAAALMNGALSKNPAKGAAPHAGRQNGDGRDGGYVSEGGNKMEVDSRLGPEFDSRGHGRGQTEEMIREQERRVKETQDGLWSKNRQR